MLRHLPNVITLCNALCGSIAIVMLFRGDWDMVWVCFGIGLMCDFLDGMLARALKVSSALGKQLDSLSDAITFGLLPAMVCLVLLGQGQNGIAFDFGQVSLWHYTAFLIVVLSILRLGQFNIDERQGHSFIGLPTPANALFWLSLILILRFEPSYTWIYNPYLLAPLAVITSLLLVAPIPLFALKFEHMRWGGNEVKYIFIGIAILLLIVLQTLAIPLIIVSYILMSLVNNSLSK